MAGIPRLKFSKVRVIDPKTINRLAPPSYLAMKDLPPASFQQSNVTNSTPSHPSRLYKPGSELLPTGETTKDFGLPTGAGLSRLIYSTVMDNGGNFAPPVLAKPLPKEESDLLAAQLTINRNGAKRVLIEMPRDAVTDPLWNFLGPDRASWTTGFRWLFDPSLGVPLFISTPRATASRGVVTLFHGACGLNSGPHSLVTPGGRMVKEGFDVVCAPTPFHKGFGPTDKSHHNIDHHIDWRQRVIDASTDYFISGAEQPKILIGRSTGANEALEFAARNPGAVSAVVALSPYHPLWADTDQMTLDTAEKYGIASINRAGTAWNIALDTQWSFMGSNTPGFPTGNGLSQSDLNAFFERLLFIPQSDRRGHFRQTVIQQLLPQVLRDLPDPLVELTPELVQRLFPEIQLPTVQSDSFLATTQTPTLIYLAGPDLEYLVADSHHFLVWVAAAAQNPNVRIVLAPRGDHDPFLPQDEDGLVTARTFQSYMSTWLDGIAPRPKPTAHQMTWGDRLILLYHALQKRDAAGLPSNIEIAEIHKADPARAERLTIAKKAIVEETIRGIGADLSYTDVMQFADRLLQNGLLTATNKRVAHAFGQMTEGKLKLSKIVELLNGTTGVTLEAFRQAVEKVRAEHEIKGKSPFDTE